MPLLYWMIAPGAGQAFRQPGSAQCMQPSLRISHSSLLFCSTSVKRITVHDFADKSIGLSYTPWQLPTSSRMSFHSEHATWQALQPIHADTSISLAISTVCRTCVDGVVVAERCLMSSDCSAISALLYAFSMLTRNALYSGVCVLASPTNGVRVLVMKPGFVAPLNP